jgi:hypothetical protein
MSMIGEYLRVTAAELERVIQDPDWALDLVEEVQDAEEQSEPTPAEARHFSTYKTWDLLRFLLARNRVPRLRTKMLPCTLPTTRPSGSS